MFSNSVSLWLQSLALVCAGVIVLPAQAQSPCERIEAIAPAKGAHIDNSKPEIRWPGDPQGSYRLQVAVVLPEGRLLQSVDTQVTGTRWAFGAPIPVPLAAIKVVVSRHCEHYTVQDLHAAPPHFFYDALAQCAIEPDSLVQVQNTLRWRASAAADRFAITLFGAVADHGKLTEMRRLDRIETTDPIWSLDTAFKSRSMDVPSAPNSLVASVQAQCGVLWSQPRAITVRPAQP